MNFESSLEYLGISDYQERIFHSNSHGELFHCFDYIKLAEHLKVTGIIDDGFNFRKWFESVIHGAEKNWSRPESIFQHIPTVWNEFCQLIKEKSNA